jgi:nickel superoxide dismutase
MYLANLLKLIPLKTAYAHCDIPCGIYDPFVIQRAAHTILRMTTLLKEIKQTDNLASDHAISRMTYVKEQHANILEEELETLRNDYFKDEHFKENINLNELFINAYKLIAKTRQNIDSESASILLKYVVEISEIFYKTKGVEPTKVKSLYPSEEEFVLHK